jgi:DNA-binding transcriptional ArsR family regulator
MSSYLKTPPMRLLRAFCLAARHSSFKDAADRLALTPSAVSHQVKELEEQLGVTLFERRSRRGCPISTNAIRTSTCWSTRATRGRSSTRATATSR